MYEIFINIHIWTSSLFVIIAIALCYRSVYGCFKNKKYTKTDNIIELLFLAFLYLGLILGLILYFFLRPENNPRIVTVEDAIHFSDLRFWAVEHFSVMIFALLIAQIGRIFSVKSIYDKDKFKYSSFYYGIASLFTFSSTVIYLFAKYS